MHKMFLHRNIRCRALFQNTYRYLASLSSSESKMEVFVDGRSVLVEPGTTIIEACEQAGVHVPRFCYHPLLSIAGNCRMCLVEVKKMLKPVASCAMPVSNGMYVLTNSPMAKKAREGVLEFLLVNHPLDCPVCDQGGECDLQDLTMLSGNDRSRFTDFYFTGKRAVVDKYIGPLIKTSMTKCIHCTRCVRFANEIAGIPDLGTTGRGGELQIGLYIEKLFMSELSGNVIDLCPVGALTSSMYSFKARPWETRKIESIDVMDALGSNIKVITRGGQLMRIQPRINDDVNEEWLSDKARFSYDGLKTQRLVSPMYEVNGVLQQCNWEDVLEHISLKLQDCNGNEIAAVVGDVTDCETMAVMKDFFSAIGSNHLYSEENFPTNFARASYVMTAGISAIDKADFILLIGTNPRYEAPVLNARIRKSWIHNDLKIALIGSQVDLTYTYEYLGDNVFVLDEIVTGVHPICKNLSTFKNPVVILGTGALQRKDANGIYARSLKIAKIMEKDCSLQSNWHVFNVLHRNIGQVGALDLGYITDVSQLYVIKPKIVFLLNADAGSIDRSKLPQECFIIYMGHNGDRGAQMANVILPGAAYTEKTATYVNTEGRVQSSLKALTPPGLAREDWMIVRALAEVHGILLPYSNLKEIRERLIEMNPVFSEYDVLNRKDNTDENIILDKNVDTTLDAKEPLTAEMLELRDYFMTNAISRSSKTMANCVKAMNAEYQKRTQHSSVS